MKIITLKPKRDYATKHRHPWIFSGAIASRSEEPALGETVQVVATDGTVLGEGSWSPHSQIAIRMLSFGDKEHVDATWISDRVARAIQARSCMIKEGNTNAFRVINAEADGLPGVTIDAYDGWLVGQFTSAGADFWKETIADSLMAHFPNAKGVYERSDADVRQREGLEGVCGILRGEEPPERILIKEFDCAFEVNVREGHKTGFYLDQRDNRRLLAGYCEGTDVLNAFCYTGGFGIVALKAGATSVTHIDLSELALEQAKANTLRNAPNADQSTFIQGNVFHVLRDMRNEAKNYDVVVLDPPKFAESHKAVMKAARGYKDINLLGIKLVRPGGILMTFSCSGAMDTELFHKVVAEAAHDAGREVQVIKRLEQATDHPEGIAFPEGFYLKGLLCRVY